jgi:hypothetical protein
VSYNKSKERLTTATKEIVNPIIERKSFTSNMYSRRNCVSVHEDNNRQLTNQSITKSVTVPNFRQIGKELDSLFDSLNKNSKIKNRLNVDCISFEGLTQTTMESLHRFFSRLTEPEIDSLTKVTFRTLAKKHGFVADLFAKAKN